MNFLKTLGSIFGTAFGVVKTAVGIGKQLLPFIRGAREMIPQVDEYLDKFEEKVAEAGEDGDDFLDRNLPTLQAMEGFYTELEAVGRTGRDYTAYAILASQSETPDTIEPGEAQELALKLNAHRVALKDLLTKIEDSDLEKKLEGMK
jgi:hypothetical protein